MIINFILCSASGCTALTLQIAQKSQVKAYGDNGGVGIAHSGLKVDGVRRSKGARGVQEETVEAWVGP